MTAAPPHAVAPDGGPARDDHHALAVEDAVRLLGTDVHHGLTEAESERRTGVHGPNELPAVRRTSTVRRLLQQLRHPLIYVLVVAGAVAGLLGEVVDASVIVGVVVVNALVGFVQESRAESALDALREMARTHALVTRGGVRVQVASEQLVPGDVVHVEAGDKVPADLRLVLEQELEADESVLTGESMPVVKDDAVLPGRTPVADRRNMAWSGTHVTSGAATGIVVATGTTTQLGEVHRLVSGVRVLSTPLTAKLADLSLKLTGAILVLAAVTFAIGMARGAGVAQMLTAAVALAVGMIPEGLPAAVSVTLAIGVSRMAQRRAIIRRLPVVETLGSTTVVCTDKTGTLTENRMTVVELWTPLGTLALDGPWTPTTAVPEVEVPDGGPLWWTLAAGAACNDAHLDQQDGRWATSGDPTESALLVSAARAGVDTALWAREATLAFSSDRQWMATQHVLPDGRRAVLVKGALERVLELCGGQSGSGAAPDPLRPDQARAAADELGARGLRVLATAVCTEPVADLSASSLRGLLVLTGVQAMQDPPRPSAASAVAACRQAGVAVKMITGDHPTTAVAIAVQLGLQADASIPPLTGADLDALSDTELADAVEQAAVFARVSPAQKLRLVQALQGLGHVVAMTGDGVNDAPALRQAQIGIAMGRSGTEVAKDAADMVLLDDDFATIEAAIEEGRGVFANLTTFLAWTVPTNLAQGLVVLLAIVTGSTLAVLPSQVLWINMTTAVLLGLTLAFEAKEPGGMRRPPRAPGAPLLDRAQLAVIAVVTLLLVAATYLLFTWERSLGSSLPAARTSAVNVLVAVAVLYLVVCRSRTGSAWRSGRPWNRWLLVGVTAQALAQAAFTYLPVMNHLFGTSPLGLEAWLRLLAVTGAVAVVLSVVRWSGWSRDLLPWRRTRRPTEGGSANQRPATAAAPEESRALHTAADPREPALREL